MAKQKIIILGGGFAGVKAALTLCDQPGLDIELISDNSNFRYYPTLFRTATGGRRMISSIPLNEIFVDKKIKIIENQATSLNRAEKKVMLANKEEVAYDTLIIGLGVKTNYFGIDGLKDFSYGIKTVEEAEELKRHLHQQLCDENKPDLNYIVIGGGPTGIELAGALPSYLRKISKCHGINRKKINVTLVEAAPRLLPRMPKDVSRSVYKHLRKLDVKVMLKSKVEAETIDGLMVDGRLIKSHSVVWTAGITNNEFFKQNSFQMSRSGKVRVNQYLQAEPDIFVVGDNADTPFSGMAQTALHDGEYIASNLIRMKNGEEPLPYIAKKPIYVFPAGSHWAAVLWGKIRLYGVLGWMLRRAADFMAYRDYEPWHQAGKRWMAESEYEDECPTCEVGVKTNKI
jgi:NADH:ubiquinone reductase (H+-translocating)